MMSDISSPHLNKHPDFIVLTDDRERGLNGAMPVSLLGRAVQTPNNQFFIRSHAPIPTVDPGTFRLSIEGLVHHPREYTLDQLLALPAHTITAVLQCAGNRRLDLHAHAPIEDELLWDAHAIGSATWTGVRLADLLDAARPHKMAAHLAFEGLDRVLRAGDEHPFGGSIPRDVGSYQDVLLAYAMNGEPLPPEHGFPLRVIVPGYIGARSVKWVTRISAQEQPSDNHYQQRAYRLFPPDARQESADWEAAPMLGPSLLNSVITGVQAVGSGEVVVRGYALAGLEQVVRVELQADDDPEWQIAPFIGTSYPNPYHAWRLWQKTLLLASGAHTLAVRAFDSEGRTQPEQIEAVWNFKGYANNAVHRVHVLIP